MKFEEAKTLAESLTDVDFRQAIISVTAKLEPSILKPLLSHDICLCGLADLAKCILHLV